MKRLVSRFDYHVKKLFKSGELYEVSTIQKFRMVQKEEARGMEAEHGV